MQQRNKPHDPGGHHRNAQERVRKSSVMREPEDAPFEVADNVDIGRFRPEHHRDGRERSLAVEPGAAQARAGQEMGDGFQSATLADAPRAAEAHFFGYSRLTVRSEIRMRTGTVPNSSPSTSA